MAVHIATDTHDEALGPTTTPCQSSPTKLPTVGKMGALIDNRRETKKSCHHQRTCDPCHGRYPMFARVQTCKLANLQRFGQHSPSSITLERRTVDLRAFAPQRMLFPCWGNRASLPHPCSFNRSSGRSTIPLGCGHRGITAGQR